MAQAAVAAREGITTVDGVVLCVRYRTEDGYTVLDIDPDKGESVTITGVMPEYQKGMRVQAECSVKMHPKYGKQYRVQTIRQRGFGSTEGLVDYISGSSFFNIGPKTAKAIVACFGMETIEILDHSPDRLLEVDGIGKFRREQLMKAWLANRTQHLVVQELISMGVHMKAAMSVFKRFGADAANTVRQDPYLLVTVEGISFRTADIIALANGFPQDDPRRVAAAVHWLLELALFSGGHCYLPLEELVDHIGRELKLSVTPAQIARCLNAQNVKTVAVDDGKAALIRIHKAEIESANRLAELAASKPLYATKGTALHRAETLGLLRGLTLSPEQEDAIWFAVSNGVSVITGGPGTGKTTVTRVICGLLSDKGEHLTLCSPTGRAAKRLSEAAGWPAGTIHRTIGYSGYEAEFNSDQPLETDCVLVDEVSMLDIELAYRLLDAVPDGGRLILVGDENQLPSVGPGYVLHDIIASDKFPVTRLSRIFRQDSDSSIVSVAHKVLHGDDVRLPDYAGFQDGACVMVRAENPSAVVKTVVRLFKEDMPAAGIEDVKLLSPMKKRELGVPVFNKALQDACNPNANLNTYSGQFGKGEYSYYAIGDPVMQLKNDYDKMVYNGDIGVVAKIVKTDDGRNVRELFVEFPDTGVVKYDISESDEIQLAYGSTIHKSQGSEYQVVILIMHHTQSVMLRRKIMYTAVTRARRMCIVVGTDWAVTKAIRSNEESKRYTRLLELIQRKG